MKKFVIVSLVLCMASLASATLQISVNGERNPVDSQIVIMPSQELILDIWTPDALPTGVTMALLTDPGSARMQGGGYAGPTDNGNIDGAMFTATEMGLVLPEGQDGNGAFVVVFGGNGVVANSTLFDGIIFHCEKIGDAIIQLWTVNDQTGALSVLQDTVVIHQVPEPATLAILGLGGLLLRRKK